MILPLNLRQKYYVDKIVDEIDEHQEFSARSNRTGFSNFQIELFICNPATSIILQAMFLVVLP